MKAQGKAEVEQTKIYNNEGYFDNKKADETNVSLLNITEQR